MINTPCYALFHWWKKSEGFFRMKSTNFQVLWYVSINFQTFLEHRLSLSGSCSHKIFTQSDWKLLEYKSNGLKPIV